MFGCVHGKKTQYEFVVTGWLVKRKNGFLEFEFSQQKSKKQYPTAALKCFVMLHLWETHGLCQKSHWDKK